MAAMVAVLVAPLHLVSILPAIVAVPVPVTAVKESTPTDDDDDAAMMAAVTRFSRG